MTNETRLMGGQPNEPMVTTKTEQRRVGLIVGAIVAVAVIVAGVVVIVTSLGGDDDTPTLAHRDDGRPVPGLGALRGRGLGHGGTPLRPEPPAAIVLM